MRILTGKSRITLRFDFLKLLTKELLCRMIQKHIVIMNNILLIIIRYFVRIKIFMIGINEI